MFVDPYIASNSIQLISSSHQATFPWRNFAANIQANGGHKKSIAGNDCSQLNANNCFFLFSLSLLTSYMFVWIILYLICGVYVYILYPKKHKYTFCDVFLQKHHNIIVFQARSVDLNTTYQAQQHTGDEISLSTAGYTSASAPWTSTSMQTSPDTLQ